MRGGKDWLLGWSRRLAFAPELVNWRGPTTPYVDLVRGVSLGLVSLVMLEFVIRLGLVLAGLHLSQGVAVVVALVEYGLVVVCTTAWLVASLTGLVAQLPASGAMDDE